MRRALLALASLALLAGCSSQASSGELNGATHDPYPVPDVALTDTEGNDYSLTADTDKRLTLLFFGYTKCPDVCQLVMSTLSSALTRLDEADREQVDVVFVTTDPARDTPEVLRRYLDRFDPSGTFVGLTGDLKTISAVGKPLAVYVSDGERLPSGGYDLNTHSTQVSGIDSADESPILWTQETSSAELAEDIELLLGDA